ncbi:MAG: recombinase family protein [Planctomycetota bacterium]|jgi:DNA invertase Pin-like site-specific DNA recombinase
MIRTDAPVITCEMPGANKIQPHHQQRLAMVYVRQSSPHQVLEHRESTALQYNLRGRAIEWGWPAERVLVIDEDQGQTAATAEGRLGFQRLLAEVGLDHVGVVLGIEMSRLARSCKDWYHLLELCALFGTLLADQDGLYDPGNYNDRLLLGLKGTLSEAELHVLRQRMEQGRLNKARRGELFNHPPTGYVRGPSGEMQIDPDEQVQAVVRLIFQKFDELGSINALLRHLVQNDIRLGIRPHCGPDRGTLQWRRPNRVTLTNLLHRPLYAGAYSWGLRPTDPRRKIPGRPSTGRTVAKATECAVLIKDRCPAYITWEQYEANLKQMADNRNRWDCRGALREGPALLKGLLVCGRCGRRLLVSYGKSGRPRYSCQRNYIDYGEPMCQSLAGRRLDEWVARQVLSVLEPASLELSLSASADIQREREELERHWRQRLERARYQKDRASRQYHAVEPENRLVARALEKQWEQSLLDERTLQESYDRFKRQQPADLTDADREMIRCLSRDIPGLWSSAHTSAADRQSIVRLLIGRVVITPQSRYEYVDVTIHFAGGFIRHDELRRSVARYDQMHDYPQLLQHVQGLADQKQTAKQIAKQLNREGWQPPKRRDTFNASMVQHLLWRRGRRGVRPRSMSNDLLGEDEWWFSDLARALDMPPPTLYSWRRRGWVHARQLSGPQGRWIMWADRDELDRLRRLRTCNRGWFNQPQAAELTTPKLRAVT